MNRRTGLSLLAAASLVLPTPAAGQGGGITVPLSDAPIRGIANVAMTVSDIDATIAFYSKALPFQVVERFKVKASAFPRALLSRPYREVEIALVTMPTGTIQLMDFEPGKSAPANVRPVIGPGYTHICFQSSSRDPAIHRFIAAGLKVISRFGKPDGVDIGGYGVRYAYGTDPDGIMIENESLDQPRRGEPGWITHIANTVHDRDAMLAFYTRVLGIRAHRTIEQQDRPRLDDVANIDGLSIRGGWLRAGNMEIEVWEYVTPRTPAPSGDRKLDEIGHNGFAADVGNLKQQTDRLRRLGVRLAGKPLVLGSRRVQYAYDPEGNLFALSAQR
jgi:catechol 2,3-dioxygenase-like lactoylglutathione lyase family enzyme